MTNRDILLDVIGDTDEELIPVPDRIGKGNRTMIRVFAGVCAAAITLAVVLPNVIKKDDSGITQPDVQVSETTSTVAVKPTEKLNSEGMYGGSMGFAGLMAYDISELDTPSPWRSDMQIENMPVYRNLAYTGESAAFICVGLGQEKMAEMAQQTADALGKEIEETTITYAGDFLADTRSEKFRDEVFTYEAKCSDNTSVTVYGNGRIFVAPGESVPLPSGYSFTYSGTTAEEADRTLDYLTKKYSALLGYEDPVCYSVADRTFSGDESRSYYVYDKAEDSVQDIFNFGISYAEFCPDDNGNLMCIWIYRPVAYEYIADYPVISEKQARKMLTDGRFYSSVPTDYLRGGRVSDGDIERADLVYQNMGGEHLQPYYRYYIRLDDSSFSMAKGLHNYGIFYVPAVDEEYLDEPPVSVYD
ncbi:MAG: hypothetical protein J6I96_01200 [Oscillospiraceae bacterium]|nr:hypothetical protein [Oscillospiraceae bacterium]